VFSPATNKLLAAGVPSGAMFFRDGLISTNFFMGTVYSHTFSYNGLLAYGSEFVAGGKLRKTKI